MTAPLRLAAFAAALVVVFLGGLLLGQLVGPDPASPEPVHEQHPFGAG